jgi:hypothetical protein
MRRVPGGRVRLRYADLDALLERLGERAPCAESVTVQEPDLDDVFLALTGQPRHPSQEVSA